MVTFGTPPCLSQQALRRRRQRNGQSPISCQVVVWCIFIEPDLFDNNVPLDNTASIYLINLLCKLGLGLGLDLELHYFRIFRGE